MSDYKVTKVQPVDFIESTNIDEHNQMIGKVNEIVNAINDSRLDGLGDHLDKIDADITKNTDDINQLKISDSEHTEQIANIDKNIDAHAREISALKAKDVEIEGKLTETDKVVDGLTKELISEVTLYRADTGKIQAQITKEDESAINSNILDMVIPYQYDLISGSSSRSFKLDIHTSDGGHIITNDFLIPEGGGTTVGITSVTLQKDDANSNKVRVSIGLSDGTPLDSGYIEMVTSVSGKYANKKLSITVNGITSLPIPIDGVGYTEGNGVLIKDGVISIDDSVVALKSDLTPLSKAVKDWQITSDTEKVTLSTTAVDGATQISQSMPVVSALTAGIVTSAQKAIWDANSTDTWENLESTSQIDYSRLKAGSKIWILNGTSTLTPEITLSNIVLQCIAKPNVHYTSVYTADFQAIGFLETSASSNKQYGTPLYLTADYSNGAWTNLKMIYILNNTIYNRVVSFTASQEGTLQISY